MAIRQTLGLPFRVIHRAVLAFIAHDVLTLSAALAYYTLLAFAPLMLIVLWATQGMGPGTRDALLVELGRLAGPAARITALSVLDSVSHRPALGTAASVVGIGVVLIGATSVFAQLQATLNTIWDIPPRQASAIAGWLRRRLISAGVLLALGFVLIVSTLVSSALGLVLSNEGPWWDALNQLMTIAIFAGLFAVLFRYVPDSRLPWRNALAGGLATSILFGLGKWLIGVWLARGDVGGAYGAAGSIVVLLAWTYYSAVVFFFSAELLQAWVTASGKRVAPSARNHPRGTYVHPESLDAPGNRASSSD